MRAPAGGRDGSSEIAKEPLADPDEERTGSELPDSILENLKPKSKTKQTWEHKWNEDKVEA